MVILYRRTRSSVLKPNGRMRQSANVQLGCIVASCSLHIPPTSSSRPRAEQGENKLITGARSTVMQHPDDFAFSVLAVLFPSRPSDDLRRPSGI